MKHPAILCTLAVLGLAGCATSTPVQRFNESASAFNEPPTLISHSYPAKDVYRLYQQGATGFVSIQSVREAVEQRAEDFARRQGKSFVILGEKISQPPYILGNFPRIEIVFALIDKPVDKPVDQSSPQSRGDKYADLERLKKLLDGGAISKAEFEAEKAKILK